MKIVNRETFLAMPSNTLYSKYEPCVFGELSVKMDTYENSNDFTYQQIADAVKCTGSDDLFDILESTQETGNSFSMDFDCIGRDGLFDNDQLFAVWEREDVVALVERLNLILK